MINVGIIGCGKIAQVRHIPEYLECPDVCITGFFDMNMERAQELAKTYGGKCYTSYQELLNDSEINAVSVCTANCSHAEIAIAALQAGKHVLCEKPMAITIEDCERMVEAAKRQNKKLMIDQNQRLAEAHVLAKKMIDSGEIGDVISFHTTFGHGGPETWSIDPGMETWFFDKKSTSIGAMADLGIHKTDLLQYITGQRVVATTAKLAAIHKRYANGKLIDVDDNAICIYELSNGAIGTMHASWTFYGEEDNSTVIYGTKGILHIYDGADYALKICFIDGHEKKISVGNIQTNDNQTTTGIIKMFIRAIKEGTEYISGESVLSAMKAVFASVESSEKGCTVRL